MPRSSWKCLPRPTRNDGDWPGFSISSTRTRAPPGSSTDTSLPNATIVPNSPRSDHAHLRVLLSGQSHDLSVLREDHGPGPDDAEMPGQSAISAEETAFVLR